MHGPIGFGHGLAGVLGAIVGFLGTLILLAIVVAVLFFLIRFLIVGTKAAQLYLDTHRHTPVVEPKLPLVEPVETKPAPVEPVETGSPSKIATSSTGPARKPRTPKAPPTL
jgi:hypothetical protein